MFMANEPTTNFPVVTYEDHCYQWTGRKNADGDWLVLVDGEEKVVFASMEAVDMEFWLRDYENDKYGSITNADGLVQDGVGLFKGYSDKMSEDVNLAVTFRTLEDVYTHQELFDVSIKRSADYGEEPPLITSPEDVLMTMDAPVFLEGTEEYARLAKEYARLTNKSNAPKPVTVPSEPQADKTYTVKVELELSTFATKEEADLFCKLANEFPIGKLLTVLKKDKKIGITSIKQDTPTQERRQV